MAYELPPLPYGYDALEPVIDAETMHLHHDKHHQTYVDNLNKALADQPDRAAQPIEALLKDLDSLPSELRTPVRNNGGGHYNHSFFWSVLAPGGTPMPDALGRQIDQDLGGLEAFKARFEEAGAKQFGSGWVFLAWDPAAGRLEVTTTANQDSLLSIGKSGLLLCDLWEHAYYLRYNNRRPEWLKRWWEVVNWQEAGRRFDRARGGELV